VVRAVKGMHHGVLKSIFRNLTISFLCDVKHFHCY